ncbi:MAG: hypothetical protein AB1489_23370 [Acidobacteriota bacterium]
MNSLEEKMIPYLLGELTEAEQSQLEEHYLSDPALFEQLLAIEDELIDAYVRGELTPSQQKHFEEYFLISERRREQLEIAKAMVDYVGKRSTVQVAPVTMLTEHQPSTLMKRQLPWLWLAFMAASVLLFALTSGWLLLENRRLREELTLLHSQDGVARLDERLLVEKLQQERVRTEQLAQQLQQAQEQYAQLERELAEREQTGNDLVSNFVLPPVAIRGGGATQLRIPARTKTIELQLELDGGDGYQLFRAQLQLAEGDQIWQESLLKAKQEGLRRSVIVRLPATLLDDKGFYIIKLYGSVTPNDFESVADYPFSVQKEQR